MSEEQGKIPEIKKKVEAWQKDFKHYYHNDEQVVKIRQKSSKLWEAIMKQLRAFSEMIMQYQFFRSTKWNKVGHFVFEELLAVVAGWTAGLMSIRIVHSYFTTRNINNLWGLSKKDGRTLVSKDELERMEDITSYIAGLIMLLLVQFLIQRLVARLKVIREEVMTEPAVELDKD
jgi:hypothetical protein